MKIHELYVKLQSLPMGGNVYIETGGDIYDFSGFSVDDNNDVELYVSVGDKEV